MRRHRSRISSSSSRISSSSSRISRISSSSSSSTVILSLLITGGQTVESFHTFLPNAVQPRSLSLLSPTRRRLPRVHSNLISSVSASSAAAAAFENNSPDDGRSIEVKIKNAPQRRKRKQQKKDADGWKVGDISRDLQLLKEAYAKSRADDEIKEMDRMDLLNEFAERRRSLSADLFKYVAFPLFLARLLQSIARLSWTPSVIKTYVASLLMVNAVYFWASTVISPILLLQQKRKSDEQLYEKFPVPKLEKWHPEYKDPRTVCKDHVLCILEHWTSAVAGCALCGVCAGAWFGFRTLLRESFNHAQSMIAPSLVQLGSLRKISTLLIGAQTIIRLGTVASFNQFPVMSYALQKDERTKPVNRFESKVGPKISKMIRNLPYTLGLDLAALLMSISGQYVAPFSDVVTSSFKPRMIYLMTGMSMFGPIIHLLCLKRILRIQKMARLSLASLVSSSPFSRAVDVEATSSSGRNELKVWRYWLRWREPLRVKEAIRIAIQNDFILRGFGSSKRYDSNFFGNVEDDDDFEDIISNGVTSSDDSFQSKLPIWQMYDSDQRAGLYNQTSHRSSWTLRATESASRKHQEDYEEHKDDYMFQDMLGVAVQKKLGIGLSFEWNHTSALEKGEEPSIHRLRSRAAKSAIRHRDNLQIEAEAYIKTISDRDKRLKIASQMGEKAEADMEEIKATLFQCIPTNAASPRENVDIHSIAESHASLLRMPLPDQYNMVAMVGEVIDETAAYDTLSRKENRDEIVRKIKEKRAAERGENVNDNIDTSSEEPIASNNDPDPAPPPGQLSYDEAADLLLKEGRRSFAQHKSDQQNVSTANDDEEEGDEDGDEFITDWLRPIDSSEDTYLA